MQDFGTTERVAANLEIMGRRALNMEEPLAEIITDMMLVEKKIFSSGGRRGGGSWARLKDDTVKRKGGNIQILRSTDDLYRSLTEPNAQYQVLSITPRGIEFGTERPWAFVHQYGNSRVPRRTFIKFLPSDITRWTRMLNAHLTKRITR